MKTIRYMILSLAVLSLFFACSDWTKTEALDYEPGGLVDSSRDDEYYAALREWKSARTVDGDGVTSRPVTFGWFSDWTGVGTSMSSQLMGLPDSVDFVSMWGNWHSLSEEKKEDLRKVQEIKGTKVLMCFIISNIGDQTTPDQVREDLTVDGVTYDSEDEALAAYWGWYGEYGDTSEEGIESAIRKYARSILDTIEVYNWDGFDLDLEPHYGSAGNIASYPDRLSVILDEFSKELGPLSGTGKMLCVDGEPDFLNPEDAEKLDYFIIQAYNDSYYSTTDNRLRRLIANYDGVLSPEAVVSRTILCSNFESYGSTGGPSYYMRDGETTFQLNAYAQYSYPDVDTHIGGIGAFRMIFDTDYTYFREAMHTLYSGTAPAGE